MTTLARADAPRSSLPGPLATAWARVWRARRLVERNILVYRHQWMIIVSGAFEPVFYLLGIGLGLGAIIETVELPDGRVLSYAAFVAPALVASAAMNGAVFETIFNVFFKLNYAKTYDGVLATPMGITEIAIGELLWALMRATLYAVVMFVLMLVMGLILSPLGVLMIPAALLVAASFAAAGLAGTSYLRTVNDFDIPLGL
ncbi:MAG: ABC transporter permease, partial [Chloroflexi bacterium]|nr:ABC transporter permease [Chloroflexota bacterium]